MEELKKSIKKRYILFLATIILIIILVVLIVQNSINSQKSDAHILNIAGRQRMLSQNIAKLALFIDNDQNNAPAPNTLEQLKDLTDDWENKQNYLISSNNQNYNSDIIDSLFKVIEPNQNKMLAASRNILRNPEPEIVKSSIDSLLEAEAPFLMTMDAIVSEYQNGAEVKLQKLKKTIYLLALIAGLIFIGEFVFVLSPVFKQLYLRNKELVSKNNELAISQGEISAKILEVSNLKADLELQQQHNKIFIDQAPTAIAMLDNDMRYIAVSQRWIRDYKMEGQEIIGRSHYDIFPEIGDDWKKTHQECLNGAIDVCDEAPFERADGSIQWIYWDVRPWYVSEGIIGGLLMHTGDITHTKEKENEKIRIESILDRTNEVARIGTWEVDLIKNKLFWSRIVCEIHEVPEDYEPDLETGINFFKEGKSRDTINQVVKEAIENGTSYDVEVELVTSKGNILWTRAIGQAEMVNGRCIRLFGVFQDINDIKISQLALNKAHTELKAIFNSGPIAIVTTDNDGIITLFNQGAEELLGYTTSEMVGIKHPEIYHLEDEIIEFGKDISKRYGKDPMHIDPFLQLASQNESDTREWTYRKKDGSLLPVLLTLTALKDENGQKIGFLGVSTDISAIKKAKNELLRKNQLLSFAEKMTMMGNYQWDVINNSVKWSTNLYQIFGLDETKTDITYETYFNFVHPDDQENVTGYVQQSLKEKKFHNNFIHRIISSDGKTKTVHLLGEVITNNSGEAVEIIGTCQDVTQQKMAENKFRGLLESAPDAMVIVNEKGKIQLINKQAEKLFGYPSKELLNKPVEILIPKRFTGNHLGHRDGFFAQPKTREMGQGKELFGKNKKGEEIPIQISLSPLQTEEGLLVSAAIRDITEQKVAENKILEANEGLEKLAKKLTVQNKQLEDFTHITSHNLRAPVSNLNSLLHLYKESETHEEKSFLFEKFETVILHLNSTLNTLIDSIKIRDGAKQEKENISFEEVLSKTMEIISSQISETDTVIKRDFSKAPKILYNRTYLESIILNLMTNSIKYKSPDRNPEIFIETENNEGQIRLKFKDNGLGIDLERHGHKLFGLNKTFHRHPDARGVGLYMTKAQIESLEGTITATSKINVGTTFTINF
ncbi:PAS domain S-box-containing protein [Saonia flava]|uniref:histidine kinase n=1 Tax=Saonia flava TaxID=523696 RepID=A0A846QZQ5_9FLAO|nr:PAS domain S-box protein [Saonia flava]NJB72400.1 PAS domain S-box-containing protein [Saonia flava]